MSQAWKKRDCLQFFLSLKKYPKPSAPSRIPVLENFQLDKPDDLGTLLEFLKLPIGETNGFGNSLGNFFRILQDIFRIFSEFLQDLFRIF